jgi:hypothetical protein
MLPRVCSAVLPLSLSPCLLVSLPPLLLVSMSPCLQVFGTPAAPENDAYVSPRGYVCYRASTPPRINGRLDDPAWRDAAWTEDFVDIEGPSKPRPRFRTRAKMLWDDDYFYIGAELEEPHVWATLTKHDAVIFRDNDFEVFINPDGDNHEYYEFEINALNTSWDLFLPRPYKDEGKPLNNWEIPGLKTAVHVDGTLNNAADTDRGWSVEIAFPWKALAEQAHRPAPPGNGDQWRVNFSRVEWQVDVIDGHYRKRPGRPEDNWVWSPQGTINMHRPETWGYVQFSTAKPGAAKFRPDPAGPARYLLHQIYYAQHAYRKTHGHWAKTVADLGLPGVAHESFAGSPVLETTTNLFEASVPIKLSDGRIQRWHIRQDSRVWCD